MWTVDCGVCCDYEMQVQLWVNRWPESDQKRDLSWREKFDTSSLPEWGPRQDNLGWTQRVPHKQWQGIVSKGRRPARTVLLWSPWGKGDSARGQSQKHSRESAILIFTRQWVLASDLGKWCCCVVMEEDGRCKDKSPWLDVSYSSLGESYKPSQKTMITIRS